MAATTVTPGRGAWTKVGMPDEKTRWYELLFPVRVGSGAMLDLSHHAVRFGVKAIQGRINEMGYGLPLIVDGLFGWTTQEAVFWAQEGLKVAVDGQVGPQTAKALFWPVIQQIAPSYVVEPQIIGGICAHESAFDPGAVGGEDDHDLGLVQINGRANPNLTMAQRFDPLTAFRYASQRIANALGTPGYTRDTAIASYGYPAVAAYWVKTGTRTFPSNPELNQKVLDYVKWINAWVPPA